MRGADVPPRLRRPLRRTIGKKVRNGNVLTRVDQVRPLLRLPTAPAILTTFAHLAPHHRP
ncbi:hypothetical protein [Streptomyces albidoflavus]|uniref:hypothetical protein n=1 Tax=Streptomyces albidoflavus TaxID=1886 RepID=UPI0033A0E462